MDNWRDIKLVDLELSCRTANCLFSAGFTTLGEVARCSDNELLRIDNFGRKSLNEIRQAILEHSGFVGVKYSLPSEERKLRIILRIERLEADLRDARAALFHLDEQRSNG